MSSIDVYKELLSIAKNAYQTLNIFLDLRLPMGINTFDNWAKKENEAVDDFVKGAYEKGVLVSELRLGGLNVGDYVCNGRLVCFVMKVDTTNESVLLHNYLLEHSETLAFNELFNGQWKKVFNNE